MPTVYREERGTWEVRFTMNYPDGTRRNIRRTSPQNTKRAAEAFERELRDVLLEEWRAKRDGDVAVDVPTLDAFAAEFLAWADANVKASTRESYESILRTGLIPELGAKRLDEIAVRDVERYKARKKVSAKTMKNHLGVLSRVFWLAKRFELITHAPDLDPPKPTKSKVEELEFWTVDEAARVLAQVDTEPRIANIVRLALATGLRLGELCGLQWTDVDLDRRTLLVRRQYARGKITTPKSNRRRRVPLSEAALDALERQKPATFMRATPADAWIFIDEGGLFSYNRIRDGYWRIVRAAGVTEISFHGLRHTFASHAVMAGVPLEVVQKWLGHSDIRQTMRYAHLAADHADQFVALLDRSAPGSRDQGAH